MDRGLLLQLTLDRHSGGTRDRSSLAFIPLEPLFPRRPSIFKGATVREKTSRHYN